MNQFYGSRTQKRVGGESVSVTTLLTKTNECSEEKRKKDDNVSEWTFKDIKGYQISVLNYKPVPNKLAI